MMLTTVELNGSGLIQKKIFDITMLIIEIIIKSEEPAETYYSNTVVEITKIQDPRWASKNP